MMAFESHAIDYSGSRVDMDGSGLNETLPLVILILIIATIGCFVTGRSKDHKDKRDAQGMIWLRVPGVIGLVFAFGYKV